MDKRQRIGWLGHLERMEEDRVPKKIFTQELEGTRRRGRPRKGWKAEQERYIQVLGVRGWREMVTGREKGRMLFDRSKPTVGCSANGGRRKEEQAFPSITQSLLIDLNYLLHGAESFLRS
jgi:hypothetical protein